METAKAVVDRGVEALDRSLEELDQICNVAQVVISEVFESGPSTCTLTVQLADVPNEVQVLISDDMFYGTSRVLTSVAMHHLDLDFIAICRGYTDGWSVDAIHALRDSLVPYT